MLVKTAGYSKTILSESVGGKELVEVLLNWLKLSCCRKVYDSLRKWLRELGLTFGTV